jgi:hypothetical protein
MRVRRLFLGLFHIALMKIPNIRHLQIMIYATTSNEFYAINTSNERIMSRKASFYGVMGK